MKSHLVFGFGIVLLIYVIARQHFISLVPTGESVSAWLLLLVSTAFIITGFVGEINEFRLGLKGLELRKYVEQAKTTATEMQNMLVDVAKIILAQIYAKGGFQSMATQNQDAIRNQVFDAMERNAVPQAKINELVDFEFPHVVNEYFNAVCKLAASMLEESDSLRLSQAQNSVSFEDRNVATLREMLETFDINSNLLRSKIMCMEFYVDNKSHHFDADWGNRDDWGK